MERRKAQEEKQLLDKLTGKGKSEKPESAGEVLAKRQQNEKDVDFWDKLRKVDEWSASEQENQAAPKNATPKGTPLEEEDWERLMINYKAWAAISERYGWGTMPEL
jgi:hypothetical protein